MPEKESRQHPYPRTASTSALEFLMRASQVAFPLIPMAFLVLSAVDKDWLGVLIATASLPVAVVYDWHHQVARLTEIRWDRGTIVFEVGRRSVELARGEVRYLLPMLPLPDGSRVINLGTTIGKGWNRRVYLFVDTGGKVSRDLSAMLSGSAKCCPEDLGPRTDNPGSS